jgi:hypothetical protein
MGMIGAFIYTFLAGVVCTLVLEALLRKQPEPPVKPAESAPARPAGPTFAQRQFEQLMARIAAEEKKGDPADWWKRGETPPELKSPEEY